MSTITKQLLARLKDHYRKPGTAQDGEILVTEVTAPGSNRSCDLLRVGMWQSRGLGIGVHELKVSRSDWLRELDDPGKADAWWRFCSRFWVVAMPGVVNASELPEGWGLMLPPNRANGRRFRPVVPAASREPEVSLPLLVEILRRADNIRVAEMQQMRMVHRRDLYTKVEQARRTANADALDLVTKQSLEKLEQVLGARISDFAWGTDLPLTEITSGELAIAVCEYTHQHVALQRREVELGRIESRLQGVAQRVLRDLPSVAALKRGDAA
ncbi:hypothetical protein [Actinomadura rubrisoli]|uniref:Uncharacterized protein n=1 Tax=Actinomadura rubrisoli TaxID=2530368 RepID=A0A4R5CF70_9ACTN|nr:hypothetical protein [Actinomadura rubrisoli]TDD97596.1 hypothetical protein E1298_00775 [Actinomadura rubrisoli]